MKFREYVEKLNQVLVDHPEYGDLPAYFPQDPEGNGYYSVNYIASAWYSSDAGQYGLESIVAKEDWEDEEEDGPYVANVVVIC